MVKMSQRQAESSTADLFCNVALKHHMLMFAAVFFFVASDILEHSLYGFGWSPPCSFRSTKQIVWDKARKGIEGGE